MAYRRIRVNPTSRLDGPAGFMRCPDPTCRLFIPDHRLHDDPDEPWSCARGHTYTWRELEEKAYGDSGGWTHAQLTCTEQGQIGEAVVRELHDLGECGKVAGWHDEYHAPLDGWTDAGWGIEVKSLNAEARNYAFVVGTRLMRERKDKAAKKRGFKGIVGALVLLDFRTSVAAVHIRAMKRVHYFEVRQKLEPFAVVKFDNPFRKQQRKAA